MHGVSDTRNEPRFTRPADHGLWQEVAHSARAWGLLVQGRLQLRLGKTACPVCEGRRLDPLVVGDRRLLVCGRCRLMFREPRPTQAELSRFYRAQRRSPGVVTSETQAESYRVHRDRCYTALGLDHHETGSRGPALDIGCGNGLNLDVLAIRGWDVEGVDPNPEQVSVLRRDGRRAVVADLQQVAADPARRDRYDLITMLHVIEHLSDPVESVGALSRLLRPGSGLLVIETPLCCDFTNPDHLFFFSGASLAMVLERAGLTWRSHALYVAQSYAHDNLMLLASRD